MTDPIGGLNTQTNPPGTRIPGRGSSIFTLWLILIIVSVIAVPVFAMGFEPPPSMKADSNAGEYQASGFLPEEVEVAHGEEGGHGEEEGSDNEHSEEAGAAGGHDNEDGDDDGHSAGEKTKRVIELKMQEWGFNQVSGAQTINLKTGEEVEFVVTNTGKIPHEFMIMTNEQMKEVRSRMEKVDFLMQEHEAIVEAAMLVPGQTFRTEFKAEEPGMYMFMCMFPYHMQMGMMGMIMVGDGDMKMDSNMKMDDDMKTDSKMNMNGDMKTDGNMKMDDDKNGDMKMDGKMEMKK